MLSSIPLSSPLFGLIVQGLQVSNFIIFCLLVRDQNLLKSYSSIIFEHNILIRLLKQVVHRDGQLFGEGFKERSAWASVSFKNMENGIHAIRLNLEYHLVEPLHEVPQRFILLHLNVLQGAYILFLACRT